MAIGFGFKKTLEQITIKEETVSMNKIERVRAALAGREVDRVPASFWFHFPAEKAHGQASVQAHLDYYRKAGIDYLKVMNEHPYRVEESIHSPSDWQKLRPAPRSARFYQEQLDELKQIIDALGGECLVISTIFGPFASGNHASGSRMVEHLKEAPAAVSQGLATIAESLAEFAQDCIDIGAAGIYYSAQGGEEDRFSEEEFLTWLKPHDLTILNAVRSRGEMNLLHICGDRIRLSLYADYPAHAVNWAATKRNLSVHQGRELFRRTVVGGMNDRGILVDGSPEAIRTAVRDVIASVGKQGFILGADCTLPTDIAIQNIRTAVEATILV
jgi:uroporphyrinogen decarboxylase